MIPKTKGTLCVSSMINNFPANNFCITLLNSNGEIVTRKFTDNHGCALVPITYADLYEIRVKSNGCHSPLKQRKWVHLYPNIKQKVLFIFKHDICYPFVGSLNITLTDANYPEYTLSKGVYGLWLTF